MLSASGVVVRVSAQSVRGASLLCSGERAIQIASSVTPAAKNSSVPALHPQRNALTATTSNLIPLGQPLTMPSLLDISILVAGGLFLPIWPLCFFPGVMEHSPACLDRFYGAASPAHPMTEHLIDMGKNLTLVSALRLGVFADQRRE